MGIFKLIDVICFLCYKKYNIKIFHFQSLQDADSLFNSISDWDSNQDLDYDLGSNSMSISLSYSFSFLPYNSVAYWDSV